ncbi:tripartite tricarboxylate transporter substrate binding protein [Xylophilus rhododendri]|uniref:Tripartite tricarboxylate transporter substrate binding protein n=1 Tax=Xylophilus rhododendri TaxID=2697032 RepID=A0A857J3Z0_9BURK|nr:tripartite tricarboxylate transporter substrate binding protein [Xylophilus rhododendri]QHI98496.1 tripartite tricarboxylate transporter substrate binding protein [Xylophilus rhododendri]
MNLRRFLGAMALGLAAACASAWAQAPYPNHIIRIVVPFTPGGGVDFAAREIGRRLEAALGRPVMIDNRPGAGGALGVRAVISSPADGYTLLMGTAGEVAMAPLINPALAYSPQRDLAPVALVVKAPNILVVNSEVPVKTLPELIAYARANPGKLSYSTSGVGTAQHLQGEYFNKLAGVNILHVPYKGSSQQVVDVAARLVSMTYASPTAVRPYLQKGAVKAIAETNNERLPVFPELPALREVLPGYELQSWFGLFAPAGTPAPIVERINKEVTAILKDPAIAARLNESVGSPGFETPAEFAALLAADIKRFQTIITSAKITME